MEGTVPLAKELVPSLAHPGSTPRSFPSLNPAQDAQHQGHSASGLWLSSRPCSVPTGQTPPTASCFPVAHPPSTTTNPLPGCKQGQESRDVWRGPCSPSLLPSLQGTLRWEHRNTPKDNLLSEDVLACPNPSLAFHGLASVCTQ